MVSFSKSEKDLSGYETSLRPWRGFPLTNGFIEQKWGVKSANLLVSALCMGRDVRPRCLFARQGMGRISSGRAGRRASPHRDVACVRSFGTDGGELAM